MTGILGSQNYYEAEHPHSLTVPPVKRNLNQEPETKVSSNLKTSWEGPRLALN